MSDNRGWLMAEKEHEARLAAVKADYERRIAQLERELAEARKLLSDRCLFIVPDEDWQDRRDAFLAADQPPAALREVISSCVKDQDENGVGSCVICGSIVQAFSPFTQREQPETMNADKSGDSNE